MNIVRGAITLMLGLVGIAFWVLGFAMPAPWHAEPEDIRWGATFSKKFAAAFSGVDWREAYRAALDDLGIRRLRLPVYWDEIEVAPGVYNFADLDWQVAEAERRGVSLILTVGQRVPRWPECHLPQWAYALPGQERHQRTLAFIQAAVERYRGRPTLRWWQVENEPFLPKFGKCPPMDVAYLDAELALVRSLDSHPVLVSDSGELSTWLRAARRADVFGTTMYKVIWNPILGQFWYPLVPEFFHAKANLVRLLTNPDPETVVVIELQAEPWSKKQIYEVGVEEHFDSMDFAQFRENLRFAQEVGFPEVYLWGVEWWYWMREQAGDDRFWEYAKTVIRS